jgi:hypothetical protein
VPTFCGSTPHQERAVYALFKVEYPDSEIDLTGVIF